MKLRLFFIILIFSIYSIPALNDNIPLSKNIIFEAQRINFYHDIKNMDFSEKLLKKCIYYEKIKNPKIVLRQAQLETGFFTSEFFWVANNVFGMRLAQVRKTTAIGCYDHHAKYLHWTDSVKDYKLFQDWYIDKGYKVDNYLVFLKWIRYATDPKYINKLI